MPLVLDYHPRQNHYFKDSHLPLILPILFTFAHINLCWQLSRTMLVSVCQHTNANFTEWTPLAWLPGTTLSHYLHNGFGPVLMFLSSLLAARLLQNLLASCQSRIAAGKKPFPLNPASAATLLLWLAWIPVPASFSFIYHFSNWAVITR